MKAKRSVAETTNPNTLSWRLRAARIARLLPLLLFLLPAAAQAQTYTNNYGIWAYTTNGAIIGTITITGYTGSSGDVSVPNTINGLPVTAIACSAFSGANLNRVTFPGSVIIFGYAIVLPAFGGEVFENCPNLTGIYFQGNAPYIDYPLVHVGKNINNNATVYYLVETTGWGPTLGELPTALWYQFTYTANNGAVSITGFTVTSGALTPSTITIPGTINGLPVTSIGGSAFSGCTNLISVILPNSVTNIGNSAFYSCTNLTGVYFQGNAPSLGSSAFDGDINATVYYYYLQGTTGWGSTFGGLPTAIWYQFTYTTNNGAITITGYTVTDGAVIPSTINIPGTINNLPVTGIGSRAFYNSSLDSVTIPDSVTSIGNWAFYNCSGLASVTIPNHVTNIGLQAFYQCYSLTNVTIGNSVTNIGTDAFAECYGLTSIIIPDSVTSIRYGAFADCLSMTGVYFLGNAPSVDPSAFSGDNLTVYYLPWTTGWGSTLGGVPTAPWLQFTYSTYNNTVTITGYTGTSGAVIPGMVAIPGTINNLPVVSIGGTALSACSIFSSVTISEGVTSLGAYAFSACTNLTSIMISDSVTSIGANAFTACTSLTAITVSTNNPVYSSVAGVLFNKNQTAIIQYPGGDAGAYTIPNGVTSIGGWSFATCANLTGVTIPDSVASIGEWAFQGCTSLASVTIPEGVTSLGAYAFDDCTSLTRVYFHGNAPSVGSSVFSGDTHAIAYYLLGTTGWENFAALTGVKTVLWNPQARKDPSFGVRTNRFGFNITGTSGLVIVVEACTNFANPVWQPVQTNILTGGASYFCDPQWTNYSARFYRFRSP